MRIIETLINKIVFKNIKSRIKVIKNIILKVISIKSFNFKTF